MTEQRRGPGRPPLSDDGWVMWTIRLPPDLAAEADRIIGGQYRRSAWVREVIERELHRLRHGPLPEMEGE